MPSSEARRDAIREILSGRPIANQGELLRRLGARGIRASQATLSRDMAMLGVRRAVGPDGPRYLVDGDGGALPLEPVRRLVDGVESNGALVIVRTKSSAAATVARALDEAGLSEVMGTLAGDDTVFVAPRRAGGGHRVAGKLRVLFGLG
ncbi:MAG TPA: arginine repressor [Polyangia bacterium]|jgi:transcriptional regulator of arginine metabolism|nr:arginine repressor [Polyangia bacterium]